MHTTPFVGDAVPSLLYIGTMHKEPGEGYERPLHHHPDHVELMLIKEGTAHLVIDEKRYNAAPRSLVIYNPGIWHEERTEPKDGADILYMAVSGFQFPDLPAGWLTDNHEQYVIPLNGHYGHLEKRFLEISSQRNMDSPHTRWIANCLAASFLIELLTVVDPPQKTRGRSKGNRDIGPVKQYIHEHYHEPISLHDLSRIAYMSPFHLSRLFKAETGVSLMQYLISYRMEVAKYFLLRTNDSIAGIAERVGYNSDTHFQNLFKKRFGRTPGQYRMDANAE